MNNENRIKFINKEIDELKKKLEKERERFVYLFYVTLSCVYAYVCITVVFIMYVCNSG